MLIGIDASRAISSTPTGTENYSRELLRALVRVDQSNQYRLYTREHVLADFFGPTSNVQIRTIPFPRLWTHVRLSYEMLVHAPDVLFVPAHVLPLIHPRNSIVTIHDLGHLHYPEAHPQMQLQYHRLATRWNANQASHVFADSEATRDDIVLFCGVKAEKVTVIYPAYNEGAFYPVGDEAVLKDVRARFRIGMDYIIAVGTIHPRKNYVRLIRSVARMQERRLQLVIVGKTGWLDKEIRSEARLLGIDDRVIFLDYVPVEHMAALLSGARAFAFPSLHEGFGLPILEAQACGVPIVCSMTSSLPEAAGDGALFIDPCDIEAIAAAMDRLLTDDPLRSKLVENGFRNLRRFSWEKSAAQVQNVIECVQ